MRLVARTAVMLISALLLGLTMGAATAQESLGDTPEPGPVAPASDQVTLDAADLEAWLAGFLPYAIAQANIAGAVVVVVDRDGIVFQQGYGYADVAARKPVSASQTLFRPGSISKLFTWTAVMQQVERGTLDLDTDINRYLDFEIPEFQGAPITLRDIMTHMTGFEEALRNLFGDPSAAPMSLETYVKSSLPARVFAPGTTPGYSNYASALAGYIVERVSGTPFNSYVERNIFAPLDMQSATFAQPLPERLAARMSNGYPDARAAPRTFEIVAAAPAGALTASGTDIGRFMVAYLNGGAGLLAPETATLMQTYRAPGIAGLNHMALGFYEKRVNGHRGIGHAGDTQSFHSDLTLFPDLGVGLFVSLNGGGTGAQSLAIRELLFRNFADRYLPPDTGEAGPGVDAETARAHAELVSGNYISTRGSFTNFLSFAGFLGQAQIATTADGTLSVPLLDRLNLGTLDWVEVAPFVWEDARTGHRVAAEVREGRVTRLSTDLFAPFMVLIPAPPMRNAAIWAPVLGVALAVIVLQALLWPVRAVIRRRFRAPFRLGGTALAAYRLTAVFAWGVVLALLGWLAFMVMVSTDVSLLSGPLDGLINALRLLLPAAAIGLLLSATAHLGLAGMQDRSVLSHIGRVLLLVSAGLIVWTVFSYRLYGFGLHY